MPSIRDTEVMNFIRRLLKVQRFITEDERKQLHMFLKTMSHTSDEDVRESASAKIERIIRIAVERKENKQENYNPSDEGERSDE